MPAVHDRAAAVDGDGIEEIEVAGGCGVVLTGHAEHGIDPGIDGDVVVGRGEVRLLHGRPQAAASEAVGADAVPGRGVDRVDRGVDDEVEHRRDRAVPLHRADVARGSVGTADAPLVRGQRPSHRPGVPTGIRSTTGLSANGRRVGVGPPLSVKAPSSGFAPRRSPGPPSAHWASLKTFHPDEWILPFAVPKHTEPFCSWPMVPMTSSVPYRPMPNALPSLRVNVLAISRVGPLAVRPAADPVVSYAPVAPEFASMVVLRTVIAPAGSPRRPEEMPPGPDTEVLFATVVRSIVAVPPMAMPPEPYWVELAVTIESDICRSVPLLICRPPAPRPVDFESVTR